MYFFYVLIILIPKYLNSDKLSWDEKFDINTNIPIVTMLAVGELSIEVITIIYLFKNV